MIPRPLRGPLRREKALERDRLLSPAGLGDATLVGAAPVKPSEDLVAMLGAGESSSGRRSDVIPLFAQADFMCRPDVRECPVLEAMSRARHHLGSAASTTSSTTGGRLIFDAADPMHLREAMTVDADRWREMLRTRPARFSMQAVTAAHEDLYPVGGPPERATS